MEDRMPCATHELKIVSDDTDIKDVGEKVRLSCSYYTYLDGELLGTEDRTLDPETRWSCDDKSVRIELGETYAEISAVAGCEASVRCECGGKEASVVVRFEDRTSYSLEIVCYHDKGDYLNDVYFMAMYSTLKNGVVIETTDMTSFADWSIVSPSGGGAYSIEEGVLHADASVGSHRIAGETTVVATYNGKQARGTATFSDIDDSFITVYGKTDEPVDNMMMIKGTKSFLKTWLTTVINGYMLPDECRFIDPDQWVSSNTGIVTVGWAGTSSSGEIEAVSKGTCVVTASWKGSSSSTTIRVIEWNDGWDEDETEGEVG